MAAVFILKKSVKRWKRGGEEMRIKVIKTNATNVKCWNCSEEAQLTWFESLGVFLCEKCSKIAYTKRERFIKRLTNAKPICHTIDGFISRYNLERFKDGNESNTKTP